jgi:hypothetical protein
MTMFATERDHRAQVDALLTGGQYTPQLSSAEVLRLAAMDPSDRVTRGRLRAQLTRLRRAAGSANVPDRRLLEYMLTAPPAPAPDYTPPANPMRLTGRRPSPRALTTGDIEYLRTFDGVDPASVSDDDAALLAELEAVASSPTERRLVERVVDPIRAHFDRQEELPGHRLTVETTSRAVAFRTPAVEPVVLPLLEERLAAEACAEVERQLDGASEEIRASTLAAVADQASARAVRAFPAAWSSAEQRRIAARDAAQARLDALAAGAPPKRPSKPAPAVSSAEEAGRERARDDLRRRGRPTQRDLLDAFPQTEGLVLGSLADRVEGPTEAVPA